MQRLGGTILAVMAAGLLLSVPATAQEGLPIVRRAIEAHGGDLFDRSETELRMCSGSGCYGIRMRMEDGVYAYRVSGPVSAGHRVVEGDNDSLRHWNDGIVQDVAVVGEQSLRDWAMARMYFVFLPYRLNDPSVLQRELGRETWDGRELIKVEIRFRAGSSTDAQDEYLYWFDPESARLEQFAYSYEGNPGGIRFRRLFNYRRVNGILFYDQENFGVDGDDFRVGMITPAMVEKSMRRISTVSLEDIRVELLGGSDR